MSEPFRFRGIVEGFYGTPWTDEERQHAMDHLGALGMNTYVYAPKDDPLHLERWREPYPEHRMREFERLIEAGAQSGIQVGFAISPGRSIVYSSMAERALLVEKLRAFYRVGCRFLSLALDDVPTRFAHAEDEAAFDHTGEAHATLVETLLDVLPDVTWWLVPTDYLGTEATDYLSYLGEHVPPEVEIGWTGRTVVSPEIRADEAAKRAETLRRKPLIWDNTPVNDGPMRSTLHLGPYTGRDPELCRHASGILLNPMQHARTSLITLSTAADYLRDPNGYDAEASWERAIETLAGPAAGSLRRFALAHRFSALRPDDRDAELEADLCALRDAYEKGGASGEVLARLREAVQARLEVPTGLRAGLSDPRLIEELEPWIVSHENETRRIEAALNVLSALDSDQPRSAKMVAFMGMEGRFTLEPGNGRTSYGARRALYPQLASMRDEGMAFGSDPALFRDRCLVDEFVALAEEQALRRLA